MTMLEQIIKDMYIDPELLEELSDEQKAILFYKMRQEQIRRWKEEEENLDKKEKKKPRKTQKTRSKNVTFLHGKDGKEWVWVMGDHKNDKSIEEILEEEAQKNSEKQAELELEEIRQKEEEEIKRKIEEEQKRLEKERLEKEAELKRKEEEAALYASLKEAKKAAKQFEEEKIRSQEEVQLRVNDLRRKFQIERRKSIEKVETNKKRRSTELYTKWKTRRQSIEKQALESSKEVEPYWQEQEKRAKNAEVQMQQLARIAREEVRNSFRQASRTLSTVSAFASGKDKPPLPPKETDGNSEKLKAHIRKVRPARPQNKNAIIAWFNDEERERGAGLDPSTNKPAEWFHGIIPRVDAENMLIDQPIGSFLVRVSERVWGYTISYRASDRCKHFLVDTTENGYQFFGTNQMKHGRLADLVLYHVNNPITLAGNEKLGKPIGQMSSPPDYLDLFKNRRTESTAL